MSLKSFFVRAALITVLMTSGIGHGTASVLSPNESHFQGPGYSILGLEFLDKLGLQGKGQIAGVIEKDPLPRTVPGLENVILNTLGPVEGDSDTASQDLEGQHASMVLQVLASRFGLGFASGANAFLVSDNIKADGDILVDWGDVIKWLVRKGSCTINLSLHSMTLKGSTCSSRLLEGIKYALACRIPVFLANGNDKENPTENKFLKSLLEEIRSCENNDLFFIVGGFEWSTPEVYKREDVFFSPTSGRATEGFFSRYFVTGPYIAPILLEDTTGFKATVVSGCSFAAPAVNAVYLRLYEYAEKVKSEKGIDLTPHDITASMKASAYKKIHFGDKEKPEWYGNGIVDARAAYLLCQKLVEAREAMRNNKVQEGLDLWIEFMKNLGIHLRLDYFFELINHKEIAQVITPETLRAILSLYPFSKEDQLEGRIKACQLFLKESFKEVEDVLTKISTDSSILYEFLAFETAFLNRSELSWVFGHFEPSMERFELWRSSFLTSERQAVTEIKTSDRKTYWSADWLVDRNSSRKLPLSDREGLSFLKDCLGQIERGLGFCNTESSELENEESKSYFLEKVEKFLRDLENYIEVPEDIASRVVKLRDIWGEVLASEKSR